MVSEFHLAELDRRFGWVKTVDRLRKLPSVKAIYMFGSAVSNGMTPMSDLDLAVVSDSSESEIVSEGWHDIDVSLFRKLPPQIRFRIVKDGKLLYRKNDFDEGGLIISSFREYMDFKPLLERFRRELL